MDKVFALIDFMATFFGGGDTKNYAKRFHPIYNIMVFNVCHMCNNVHLPC